MTIGIVAAAAFLLVATEPLLGGGVSGGEQLPPTKARLITTVAPPAHIATIPHVPQVVAATEGRSSFELRPHERPGLWNVHLVIAGVPGLGAVLGFSWTERSPELPFVVGPIPADGTLELSWTLTDAQVRALAGCSLWLVAFERP